MKFLIYRKRLMEISRLDHFSHFTNKQETKRKEDWIGTDFAADSLDLKKKSCFSSTFHDISISWCCKWGCGCASPHQNLTVTFSSASDKKPNIVQAVPFGVVWLSQFSPYLLFVQAHLSHLSADKSWIPTWWGASGGTFAARLAEKRD